ncbi:MAG TPA: hypothetical protein V6C96_00930, partial [Vampirovibrionales bacterium]
HVHKEELECESIKAKDFKGITKEFFKNVGPNFKNELKAGKIYTKKIFNGETWKEIGQAFTGKHPRVQEKEKGVNNPFAKAAIRLGFDEFTCVATMINGLTRFFSVLGTALTLPFLGGIKIFNQEDDYLKSEKVQEIVDKRPFAKFMFDATMEINNIGNAFMGICSLSNGFNPTYIKSKGALPAMLQVGGGTLHMISVGFDTIGLYIFGQAFKLMSNACFQLANSFAATNKAVPNLIATGTI